MKRLGGERETVARAVTDARGSLLVADISPGFFVPMLSQTGYASRLLPRYDNRFPECYELSVGLAPAKSITGVVVDREGHPLAGIKVKLRIGFDENGDEYKLPGTVMTVTDSYGRFELTGLPAGRARLSCRAPSWHCTSSIFDTHPCHSKDLRLVMDRTGIVKGNVVDENGKPPTRTMILELRPPGEQLGKWGHSGHLADDGSFEISGIPPGEYIITARPNPGRADHKSKETKVTVKGGETVKITLDSVTND